jgi:hypothetical protein
MVNASGFKNGMLVVCVTRTYPISHVIGENNFVKDMSSIPIQEKAICKIRDVYAPYQSRVQLYFEGVDGSFSGEDFDIYEEQKITA